jgi:hypothetical protein
MDEKNNEPLTQGFVQAGLDVETSVVYIAVRMKDQPFTVCLQQKI